MQTKKQKKNKTKQHKRPRKNEFKNPIDDLPSSRGNSTKILRFLPTGLAPRSIREKNSLICRHSHRKTELRRTTAFLFFVQCRLFNVDYRSYWDNRALLEKLADNKALLREMSQRFLLCISFLSTRRFRTLFLLLPFGANPDSGKYFFAVVCVVKNQRCQQDNSHKPRAQVLNLKRSCFRSAVPNALYFLLARFIANHYANELSPSSQALLFFDY